MQEQAGLNHSKPKRARGRCALALLFGLMSVFSVDEIFSLNTVFSYNELRSYDDAFTLYRRGDFQDAEQVLREILAIIRHPPKVVARHHKLLGIVQFMQNRRAEASQSFQRALELDAESEVKSSEVFHSHALKFFVDERRHFKKVKVGRDLSGELPKYRYTQMESQDFDPALGPVPASGPDGYGDLSRSGPAADLRSAQVPQERPLPGSMPRRPAQSGARTPTLPARAAAKKPATSVTVLCNVPQAKAFIDGILLGGVNTPLGVDPGVISLEVNAPGYHPVIKRIAVQKDKESVVTITLNKKALPEQPKLAGQSEGKAAAASASAAGAPQRNNGGFARAKRANPRSLFEGSAAPQTASTAAPTSDSDLAKEFELDAQKAAGPPMQAGAPAATMNGRGIVPGQIGGGNTGFGVQGLPSVQGGYVFPSTQGGSSQQPIIIIQVPQAAPAAAPFYNPYSMGGGAGTVPSMSPGMPSPVAPPPSGPGTIPPPPPRKNGMNPLPESRSSTSTAPKRRSHFYRLLPFGIPQYYLSQPILGTLFAAGQIGCLYFYYERTTKADAEVLRANDIINERNANQSSLPEADQPAWEAETNQFQEDQQTVVNEARQQAQFAMIGFFGLWGLSAITAYYYDPEAEAKPSKLSLQLNLDPQLRPGIRSTFSLPFLLSQTGVDTSKLQAARVGLDLKFASLLHKPSDSLSRPPLRDQTSLAIAFLWQL